MNEITNLSAFIECSTGSTPTVASLKKHIDLLEQFGYDRLWLGVTDAYKIPGEPYFNYNRGGYTKEQFQELDAYAKSKRVELCLNFQTLAHLGFLGKYGAYSGMMDTADILMVGDERVYTLIDKMFASLSESVSSRTIHIGMDEAFNLGLGNYLKKNGYREKSEILLEHLNRVCEIAKKYNYSCEIWSDMFFRLAKGSDFDDSGVIPDEIKGLVPEGVRLVHWKYDKQPDDVLRNQLETVKAITGSASFAGCAWKSMGLAPNNKYSIAVMERQFELCRETGIDQYMVTLWSDGGAHCSTFAVLPSLFAASEFAKGKTAAEIDKERFMEIVGLNYDSFMLLDNLNYPFFNDTLKFNCRCYWGLFTDLIIPYYDALISEGSNEAYAALAEKYAAIDAGEYQPIFNNYINMARVLSIKMNLSQMIRKAYKAGDKALIEQYATKEIPQMIAYMETYIEEFERFWLWENMAYGLEVHHHFDGGLIIRWKSVARRLLDYVQNGTLIEELEHEALGPSLPPTCTEDSCFEMNYRNIISFCGI